MTIKQEQKIKKLIEIGHNIEDLLNWNKPTGKENKKAIVIIKKLAAQYINPYEIKYSYVDENGFNWDLEYAMQFIEIKGDENGKN